MQYLVCYPRLPVRDHYALKHAASTGVILFGLPTDISGSPNSELVSSR
jgi:hypothetical protein